MNTLTIDLQMRILSLLDAFSDLASIRASSKRFKTVSDSNFVWTKLWNTHFEPLDASTARGTRVRANFLSRGSLSFSSRFHLKIPEFYDSIESNFWQYFVPLKILGCAAFLTDFTRHARFFLFRERPLRPPWCSFAYFGARTLMNVPSG